MAFSLSNLFTSGNGNPTPAQPATPGNTPAQPAATAVDDVAGTAPNPAPNAPAQEHQTPLDKYKDIWETVPNAAGDEPSFELDATKVSEAMANADFSKAINQETLSKIVSGGEDAAMAFAEAMNAVTRQAMTQSTLVANKLIETRLEQYNKKQEAAIPGLVKRQAAQDANPIFKNPAAKPMISALQNQLAAKNPDASAAELVDMTNNFLTALYESMNPDAASKAGQSGSEPPMEDWDKFLG